MYYKNEKDLIVEKLEELISRGKQEDPEVQRLVLARHVLLGSETAGNTGDQSGQSTTDITTNQNVVDEFATAYQFLIGLRNEKDLNKAVSGLIEVVIFIFKIVTALSSREATRK